MDKPTVAVDFDGVLNSYVSGWQGVDDLPDLPNEGAMGWLRDLADADIPVYIFTTRAGHKGGIAAVRDWLFDHLQREYGRIDAARIHGNIQFATGKPRATLYLDDRALRFEGQFPSVETITNFKPWRSAHSRLRGETSHYTYLDDRAFAATTPRQKKSSRISNMYTDKPREYVVSSTNMGICVDEAIKSGEMFKPKFSKGMSRVEAKRLPHMFDKDSEMAASVDIPTPFPFDQLLGYAHKTYKISKYVEDYVLVPVPIIITDIPNANGVGFPAKSLSTFSPVHGMPHFKTWVGKPTHDEHQNSKHTQSKGIVIDSVMNPVRNRPNFWKVVTLLAFDRTKDKAIYDDISKRRANAYSMGAYLEYYKCSICDARAGDKKMLRCNHIGSDATQFYQLADGRLVYREAWFPQGFEISRVDNPAYAMSVSDMITRIEEL